MTTALIRRKRQRESHVSDAWREECHMTLKTDVGWRDAVRSHQKSGEARKHSLLEPPEERGLQQLLCRLPAPQLERISVCCFKPASVWSFFRRLTEGCEYVFPESSQEKGQRKLTPNIFNMRVCRAHSRRSNPEM